MSNAAVHGVYCRTSPNIALKANITPNLKSCAGNRPELVWGPVLPPAEKFDQRGGILIAVQAGRGDDEAVLDVIRKKFGFFEVAVNNDVVPFAFAWPM